MRIGQLVGRNSMDLLQAAHTWSGIEIALWDLLGRVREEPVWRLLGYTASHAKVPYASMLFGDTPQATLELARAARAREGFRAVKFGWGGYGTGSAADDADHVAAAREGLGDDALLLIDAGQIWGDDVERAAERLPALERPRARRGWRSRSCPHAFAAHAALARRAGDVAHRRRRGRPHRPHGDEPHRLRRRPLHPDRRRPHRRHRAPRRPWRTMPCAHGVTYVNHTFTSHLALSASLQPFAGLADHRICEYPVDPKQVALDLSANHLLPDANGEIRAPDAPGLGIEVDLGGPGAVPPAGRDPRSTATTVFRSPDPRPVLEAV